MATDVDAAVAAAVSRVAAARRVDVELRIDGVAIEPCPAVAAGDIDADLLAGDVGPWLPGMVREAVADATARRSGGVHHTSPDMAAAIIAMVDAIAPFDADTVVGDPAVGGGAFLLAALDAMPGDRADRLTRIVGCDIDPSAVAVTEASLALWGDGIAMPAGAIRVADGLLGDGFDPRPSVVVGNPPFLSQLHGDTARDDRRRGQIRSRWPEVARYVDEAAAFLLAGVDAVEPGGVVALVQPASFLAASDAAGVRHRLRERAPLAGVWIDGERQFDAAVDTIAPVLRVGDAPGTIRRWRGVPAEEIDGIASGDLGESWAMVLPGGPPSIDRRSLRTRGTVGDIARVTAGFRDQFYGLDGAVREDPDGPHRLITSGLIDPLHDRWGSASCTFARTKWRHPSVMVDSVDASITDWVADRLVPKLLLASQTRVLEVMIDADGSAVPCTPVVSVEPQPDAPSLAHLAAALSAPVISALLVRDAAGSALSRDAVRVAAPAIAALPLPPPGPAWDAAALAVDALDPHPTSADLRNLATLAHAAYGIHDREDLVSWWHSRLPRR